MPKTKPANYQKMSTELDEILTALQNPNVHIDEAVALYERGLQLTVLLEARIKDTENKITALTLQVTGE